MKQIVNIADIWDKALDHAVKPIDGRPGHYQVFSKSGGIYDVEISGRDVRSCNCENGLHTGRSGCSHILAAARLRALDLGYTVEPHLESEEGWDKLDRDAVFRIGQGVVLLGISLTRWDDPEQAVRVTA